jgi:predicted RNase H-like HicB family nuclease
MKMKKKITRVIRKRGDWYIAYIKEIPGVNTQGRTFAEARENLKDALQLILEENRRLQSEK